MICIFFPLLPVGHPLPQAGEEKNISFGHPLPLAGGEKADIQHGIFGSS